MNIALEGLVSQCLPGAKILDLCQYGTTLIQTEAAKLYTKKVNGQTIDRGVAFPVCISVNEVVCNHSPLASEERVSEEKFAHSESLFSFFRARVAFLLVVLVRFLVSTCRVNIPSESRSLVGVLSGTTSNDGDT